MGKVCEKAVARVFDVRCCSSAQQSCIEEESAQGLVGRNGGKLAVVQ